MLGAVQQFGTADEDQGFAVGVDSTGSTVLAGHTRGVLGAAQLGGWDGVVLWLTP